MTARRETDEYFDQMFGTLQPLEAEFLNALNGTQPDNAAAALAAAETGFTAALAHERARIADERAALANQRHRITTTANSPERMTPEDWFTAFIKHDDEDDA